MTDKEVYKEAIKEAFDEEIKPLYVEREQHFRDHLKIQKLEYKDILFLTEWRKWVENIKDTTTKTIVKAIVIAIIGLIVVGAGIWAKIKYFSGHGG